MDPQRLSVRAMRLEEVDYRIDYFHGSSDEHLRMLGVDRALLPDPSSWRRMCEVDYARPLSERESFFVLWELDRRRVGFSSLDRIAFGAEAFMHLHVVEPSLRHLGIGSELVGRSAALYLDLFELEVLFCEPNALNVAPNRTLQRAGFTYLFSHETTPGAINFPQVTTRWKLTRASLSALSRDEAGAAQTSAPRSAGLARLRRRGWS